MASSTVPCFKCNGSGEVSFRHIANGVCFQCGGAGRVASSKAQKGFTPVAPVVADADRSTAAQWNLLARLAGESDTVCRKWLKAAGAPVASQIYVSKAVMSRAIEIGKVGA